MPLPPLSLLETRVLGVLVEKQHTVPDTYPLTLNALVSGCNQKTSRDPGASKRREAEVQAALDRLKTLMLVDRVERRARHALRAQRRPRAAACRRSPWRCSRCSCCAARRPPASCASTASACTGSRTSRRSKAFSTSSRRVPDGALVVELARAPGARETRWAHLLSGPPALPVAPVAEPAAPGERVAVGELVALRGAVTQLEGEVARLRATVDRVLRELGLPAG